MDKLLQAKIAQVRVQRLTGKLTDDHFNFFVRGVNQALRYLNLQYISEQHEVVEFTGNASNFDLSDLESADPDQLGYFKRGFFLVKEVADSSGKPSDELEDEAQQINEL